MGRWKDHVFDEYERLGCEPECADLDDDQIWTLAEQRARDRLADLADYYRGRAKEGR